MTTILLTGFEPFGGHSFNPSQEIAKALDGRRIGGHTVRSLLLPVRHESAREQVVAALDDPDLAVVLHLGLGGGRARIALEHAAVNVMDYAIPDNCGDRITGEPCIPDGAAAYFSTLPSRAILAELTASGIPAYVSYSAGTFLCNYTLYSTLEAIARRGLSVPAGFIHVPFLPSMVAAHGLDQPSMELSLMILAAETALRISARGTSGRASP